MAAVMKTSNQFNILLCLIVLTTGAFYTEKSLFSEHATGIQAATTQWQINTNDDPDHCILEPTKNIFHNPGHTQYVFFHAANHHFNYHQNSARAPPLVSSSS